jgi:hypothetical protein
MSFLSMPQELCHQLQVQKAAKRSRAAQAASPTVAEGHVDVQTAQLGALLGSSSARLGALLGSARRLLHCAAQQALLAHWRDM